jgi:hypothetical protein
MFAEAHYWLDAGVDLRLDAITTLAHDPELRDNPVRQMDPREFQISESGNNPINWQEWNTRVTSFIPSNCWLNSAP